MAVGPVRRAIASFYRDSSSCLEIIDPELGRRRLSVYATARMLRSVCVALAQLSVRNFGFLTFRPMSPRVSFLCWFPFDQ